MEASTAATADAATGTAVIDGERIPGLAQLYSSPIYAGGRVYFTLGGAEANENAIRAARLPIAAALRAAEISAQAILKGTHSGVDGVYTADPKIDKTATRFDKITYLDVISKGLKVMDSTAITFCMDNKIPIVVFNLLEKCNVRKILEGQKIGTLV